MAGEAAVAVGLGAFVEEGYSTQRVNELPKWPGSGARRLTPTAPRTRKRSPKNVRKRLETAKKHFEERQYRDALVAVQHALERPPLPSPR